MFLPENIMLLNGKNFPGSSSYVDKHLALRAIAGSGSLFTEFQPFRFPNIQTFHQLLFLCLVLC